MIITRKYCIPQLKSPPGKSDLLRKAVPRNNGTTAAGVGVDKDNPLITQIVEKSA
jgi:hypothetical protein